MEGGTGTFNLTSIPTKEDPAASGGITGLEEKELRRVFDLLCDFSFKTKLLGEIGELEAWQDAARNKVSSIRRAANVELITERVDSNHAATQKQIDDLRQEIIDIENKESKEKKISCADVTSMYQRLHQKTIKSETEELIWEVDEDLDGCVNWSEFRLMFGRNIRDKSGLEPSRMFHLTQFLIYDHNQNGLVSVDETMHMLYARYGRPKMELKLKELFGEDMAETGREGGEITFSKYLSAVEKIQLQTFYGTTKGRITAAKDTIKRQSTSFDTTKKKNLD